jgi:hypothetical protein
MTDAATELATLAAKLPPRNRLQLVDRSWRPSMRLTRKTPPRGWLKRMTALPLISAASWRRWMRQRFSAISTRREDSISGRGPGRNPGSRRLLFSDSARVGKGVPDRSEALHAARLGNAHGVAGKRPWNAQMSFGAVSLSDHLHPASRGVARFGGGAPASAAGILVGAGRQEPRKGNEMTGDESLRLIRGMEAS